MVKGKVNPEVALRRSVRNLARFVRDNEGAFFDVEVEERLEGLRKDYDHSMKLAERHNRFPGPNVLVIDISQYESFYAELQDEIDRRNDEFISSQRELIDSGMPVEEKSRRAFGYDSINYSRKGLKRGDKK